MPICELVGVQVNVALAGFPSVEARCAPTGSFVAPMWAIAVGASTSATASVRLRGSSVELPYAELPLQPAAPSPGVGPHVLLGELLVRRGDVTREEVEAALTEQRELGGDVRLGELLVSRNHLSTKALAEALAEQQGLEFVDLARVEVEPAAVSLLTEQFARRAQVLPVRFLEENLVQVAVADPTNLRTADDLRLALGLNIRLAVADSAALEGTIARTYRVYIE